MTNNHEIWRKCTNCGSWFDLRKSDRCDGCGKLYTENRKNEPKRKAKFVEIHFMKKELLIIGAALLLSSCGQNETHQNNAETEQKSTKMEEKTPLEQLELEASRLRAGGSVKEVKLTDGKAEITYVKDYEEYKKLQPQSAVTEADLKAYWDSGSAIKKALNDGSVRIMRKLDFVNEVKITLPYDGKTYSIDVSKSELEKFLGMPFKSVLNDWDNTFSNPYVYSDTGREKFFSKFGNVK
jgi:hypothetical protein